MTLSVTQGGILLTHILFKLWRRHPERHSEEGEGAQNRETRPHHAQPQTATGGSDSRRQLLYRKGVLGQMRKIWFAEPISRFEEYLDASRPCLHTYRESPLSTLPVQVGRTEDSWKRWRARWVRQKSKGIQGCNFSSYIYLFCLTS